MKWFCGLDLHLVCWPSR